MGRPSKGERRALTIRVPVELHAVLVEAGGTSSDVLAGRLRRSVALDLSDDDLRDLDLLAGEIGFTDATELVRAFIARELHNVAERRAESAASSTVDDAPEPPEPPAATTPSPFSAEELADADLAEMYVLPPPPSNGPRPLPRVWPPPRPLPPRPPWERS